MADPGTHGPIRHELFVQTSSPENGFDHRQLIVLIVDGEPIREAGADIGQPRAIAPQQPHAKRMKRGNQWTLALVQPLQQILDALAHFVRRLIGERDCDNGGPGHPMDVNEMRHAVRDHPRFAASGAGQQQQRTFDVLDSRLLLRI